MDGTNEQQLILGLSFAAKCFGMRVYINIYTG